MIHPDNLRFFSIDESQIALRCGSYKNQNYEKSIIIIILNGRKKEL